MEVIQGLKETNIDKINMPTLAAFIPILEEKKAAISKIERKAFQYGPKSRHHLDVYYPPAGTAGNKTPVLFFVYGGGYNTGSRRFPEPYDLGYRALAAFFATRGIVTVIPDYRLVPEVRFPASSEDVRDALVWVVQHADVVGVDIGNVFVLGHSAGAAHVLTVFGYAPVSAGLKGVRVRGVVLSGCPWYLGVLTGPVKFYYGEEEERREREPAGLWRVFEEVDVRAFPDLFLIQAEREPDWLREQTKEVMEKEIREKFDKVGRKLDETYIAKGHNHVSVNWGLSTGDARAEQWGVDLVAWIKARLD